ncbi:MAG: sulfatase maturase [Bacteroidetes bacterium MedPE-SWsnd-G2]|nr:MAG: sulfatase maturase [Bacteroidetes bacterium MedPE-SWsnd-G2]
MTLSLKKQFHNTRNAFVEKCKPLQVEDYSVQPVDFVSPPKWHLAHTTWFFEQFVLVPHMPEYSCFDKDFAFLFNSYYEAVGERVMRANRGLMTRPSVAKVFEYRAHVDEHMLRFLDSDVVLEVQSIIALGLKHEQQHLELFQYDIKYILGHQPTFPHLYQDENLKDVSTSVEFLKIEQGLYDIGYNANGFCFDNELGYHKVWLEEFQIANQLVSNKSYLKFIEAGGYNKSEYWHAEGWDFINEFNIKCPMYWHQIDGVWFQYTLKGLQKLNLNKPVIHISFYEAWAYCEWSGQRLPTEFEWEVASFDFNWGEAWEWTNSAYLPYPNYKKEEGAIGEYNGKFMVNQMVLRGASVATFEEHSRPSYRNFFHPQLRWMYSGIRPIKKHE